MAMDKGRMSVELNELALAMQRVVHQHREDMGFAACVLNISIDDRGREITMELNMRVKETPALIKRLENELAGD